MTSLFRKQRGFTIVELLIVIVVIGILAALVITTFSGIQQKSRDTERQTDIKALHGQLEAYFAQWGWYPDRNDMNTSAWRTTNMKGLDAGALQDPQWKNTNTNCTTGGNPQLVTGTFSGCYIYNPLNASNAACTTALQNCSQYTLTANLEGQINGLNTFSKNSLN